MGDMAQPTETIFRQFELCNNIPTEATLVATDRDWETRII